MGDAILCTPALRALRRHFKSARITFLARPVVRDVLSPSEFNDVWLEPPTQNPFIIAAMLKSYRFSQALLLKNSFASALAVFLAKIPVRIGYARQGRSIFLTKKLYPPKGPSGGFKPISMIDYYLEICSAVGAEHFERLPQLLVDADARKSLEHKLPEIVKPTGPVVVLVPAGAFGPSKYWPAEKFAKTADWLVEKYNATVVISVADNPVERQVARAICRASKYSLLDLGRRPVSLAELKALFARAELVITNDTGPRHIAIALGRNVVTVFGPNDPAWTQTGYANEIQLVGKAPCSPCQKPKCRMKELLCMQSITVDMVCRAAEKFLGQPETWKTGT